MGDSKLWIQHGNSFTCSLPDASGKNKDKLLKFLADILDLEEHCSRLKDGVHQRVGDLVFPGDLFEGESLPWTKLSVSFKTIGGSGRLLQYSKTPPYIIKLVQQRCFNLHEASLSVLDPMILLENDGEEGSATFFGYNETHPRAHDIFEGVQYVRHRRNFEKMRKSLLCSKDDDKILNPHASEALAIHMIDILSLIHI